MSPPASGYQVLFLCTGNSARSIMAEAAMNHLAIAGGRFRAYSAGSQPTGLINPWTIETLRRHGLPTSDARSKSWAEFARPDSPKLDFVFTVCASAAGESCPLWPGQPMTAHWGVEDPAAVKGSDEQVRRAFNDVFLILKRRIELFASLPTDKLNRLALFEQLQRIGRS